MKKLRKEQFPDIAESPRTLKKKLMDKHPQKYANQSNDKILSYYERKTDHELKNGSVKEIISQSDSNPNNDDFNINNEREVSKRMNSIKPDSMHKNDSIRNASQYRKTSDEHNNIELLNENQKDKKTFQQKNRKDSQETYQPNINHVNLSINDWNGDIQ